MKPQWGGILSVMTGIAAIVIGSAVVRHQPPAVIGWDIVGYGAALIILAFTVPFLPSAEKMLDAYENRKGKNRD